MSRRLPPPLLIAVGSTAAGVYFASQLRWAYPDLDWGRALAINLAYYWAWGALAPLVIALARRFPFDGGLHRRALVAHVALGAVLTVLEIVAAACVLRLLDIGPQYAGADFLQRALLANFHASYPTYWVILLAYLSFDYYAKYRDHALQAAQLEARLSEARLTALRMQLNPHFLFNTLNSISSLMYSDVAAADAMMARLSELLRLTLHADGRPEVSLRQELELLGRYVEIERLRFEERLSVGIDAEAATLDASVPAFVLQPLVENAIRHAIAPRPEGGHVLLLARRENGHLRICISDDGPGLPPGGAYDGVGLGNTRARLAQLYGADHAFELDNLPQGGLRVALTIPFRAAR